MIRNVNKKHIKYLFILLVSFVLVARFIGIRSNSESDIECKNIVTKSGMSAALLLRSLPMNSSDFLRTKNLCRTLVPASFKSIRKSIISAWTVLDLIRAMQINEKDKIKFAYRMFDDMISVLTGLANLSTYKNFCSDYYANKSNEIYSLQTLLFEFASTFEIVFNKRSQYEESALYKMILRSAHLLKALHY